MEIDRLGKKKQKKILIVKYLAQLLTHSGYSKNVSGRVAVKTWRELKW